MSIDYRNFKDENDPSKAVEKPENARSSIQWWKERGTNLSAAIWNQIKMLQQADQGRIQLYRNHSHLYGGEGTPMNSFGQLTLASMRATASSKERIAFNVIQSCVDSLTSKISKNKPKAFFLTSKGDSKIQRKAKKLDQFTTGVFYDNQADRRMPIMFRDACVWGEGITHVYDCNSRVRWERVLPWEILVDALESLAGPEFAKTMHRIKLIDRETLKRWIPGRAAEVDGLISLNDSMTGSMRSIADTVAVAESWRLPSEPGADDGVHCISTPGLSPLREEKWGRDNFPFAILRYSPRLHGFWGQGLAEQITPIQVELNRCLMTIQRSFQLGGSFKVLLHASSQVVKSHVDNTIGAIIQWAGEIPPQYITPPMVPREIFEQVQVLKALAYEQSGISQLSAGGQKPQGINSGKGLRETVDIETDRFQTVGQSYERTALELADLSIWTAKEIAEDGIVVMVKVPGKRFIESVDWSEVDMENDEYVMQCFPVSKLPSTPEGRLETIQEMMQAGLIDPETGRRLLDYPDLDEQENLANAQLDYLHDVLDGIVEDGKYREPEPDDNNQAGLKLAIEYLAVGKRDNLKEERKQLLRDFIAKCNQWITASMSPAPMSGMPAGPQAVPEAPPTSNILPNAPAA